MSRKIRMQPVSVRLSPVIHHSLSAIADREKTTLAEVIRQCIYTALDNQQKEDHYATIGEKLDTLVADTAAIRSVIEHV